MARDSGDFKIDLSQTESLLAEYGKDIEAILRRAVREALLRHKRAGNPVAVWRDGKVVLLQPKEILLEANDDK